MKALLRVVATTALLLAAVHAFAQETDIVDRWYQALLKADRAALSELLADDATIRLEDIGVTQTKAEFIASMDEWEAAVSGATIRHTVESTVGDTTTVLACYDFPTSKMLMRETFTTRDGRIVANTQVTVGDGACGSP